MKSSAIILLFLCLALGATTQGYVYPTNWWVGMKNPFLQLMIRDTSWTSAPSVSITYPGVQVLKVKPAANPHYVFVDVHIGKGARPGIMKIQIRTPKAVSVIEYMLAPRR
ncbi:MAG TPA: cyclomaltodextrinase N-terminal domain-containing protein, partial [Puia sp.]